jgi:hypothetical protein
MQYDNGLASAAHLTSLQQRLRVYRWLCCALLSVILVGIGPTVPAPVALPEVIRGTRLELVNNAGQVVLRADAGDAGGVLQLWSDKGTLHLAMRATPLGGRLEILDAAAHQVFSVGLAPAQELPGQWEQSARAVETQGRELTRQQQQLTQLARRMSALEQLDRSGTSVERQLQSTEDLRRDLDQQRRELDQQRRLIDAVERQLRILDRR